ncbi:MAG: hypothetical protein AB8H86_20460 [Polyangiales bacterium]
MRNLLLLVACFSIACGDDSSADAGGRNDSGPVFDGAAPDVPGDDAGPCEEGEPCDADGDGCTMDTCRRGRCVLGTNTACDDGASCTVDECRSTGPMTFECDRRIGTNFCAIDSMCFRDDDANPMNLCQVCQPSQASMEWTTLTAECDDQNSCTSGDTCETGECIGVPILDDFEDNPTRGEAARLGAVADDETFPSGDDVVGTLFPEGDEDWYVYRDTDENLGRIFPRVDLTGIPEGTDYELCAFVSCTENETLGSDCPIGTEAMMDGLPGCCSNASGNLDESVRLDHDCDGGLVTSDDTVEVYVRVRQVEGDPVCDGGYTLLYGDD